MLFFSEMIPLLSTLLTKCPEAPLEALGTPPTPKVIQKGFD